ncbi:TPT-domain-containing protein [Ascoidea rubescens DSM 1968]|uniref:TPT-domain-containing protein n=1 Tax=Ascoidea rubescens DSM 1968 TaxID=1344418 RepID=A0A1D2VC54_9ASCO|nr:TPT-domain-containing protein [Ascoidea rubescens DSM 1968]ODV59057.1 TPT-domain-containing protein [Ascoidea rubescens DSM 1968]
MNKFSSYENHNLYGEDVLNDDSSSGHNNILNNDFHNLDIEEDSMNTANNNLEFSNNFAHKWPRIRDTLLSLKSFLLSRRSMETFFCIIGWYIFSLTISLYNKWMFSDPDLNLPFPVLITSFHQLTLFFFSSVFLIFVPSLRPDIFKSQINLDNDIGNSTNLNRDGQVKLQFKDYLMDPKLYVIAIVPCAVASAADIGSGNASLKLITLSFYTMVKSSSIMFVLLFGILFGLESASWTIGGIVSIMTIGVILLVAGGGTPSDENVNSNAGFQVIGFFLVLTSSIMSGLRWTFTQLLLKKNKYTSNPISTIFYLAPLMSAILFVIGNFLEDITKVFENKIWKEKGIVLTLLIFIFPGVLAFFMTIFEFALLQRSHVITLSIAGIFKELLTIVASVITFGDSLNFLNIVGLIITLSAIIWYNWFRFKQSLEDGNYDLINNNNNGSNNNDNDNDNILNKMDDILVEDEIIDNGSDIYFNPTK